MTFHNPGKMTSIAKCLTAGCARMAATRGLCGSCYGTALRHVKLGRVSWEELVKNKIALPAAGQKKTAMSKNIRKLMLRLRRDGKVMDGAFEEAAAEAELQLAQFDDKCKNPDPLTVLDAWEVGAMVGVDERTIRRWSRQLTFPPPLKMGLRRVGWRRMDIQAWMERSVETEVASLYKKVVDPSKPAKVETKK